jgi:hypothetical protein
MPARKREGLTAPPAGETLPNSHDSRHLTAEETLIMSTTTVPTLQADGVDLPRVVTRWLFAPACPPQPRPAGKRRSWPDPWARWFIYWRDRRTCRLCGRPGLLDASDPRQFNSRVPFITLGHIIPWADGGCDHVHNLLVECSRCNFRKGRRP